MPFYQGCCSLRTASCFVPQIKITDRIHKLLQSNSLRNAYISEQHGKGSFCTKCHQPSTLERPSFPDCNRIPQLCYLRSRVQYLQVLNQYFRVWLSTCFNPSDYSPQETQKWENEGQKGEEGGISPGGGRVVFPAFVYLGKLYPHNTRFQLSLVYQKPERNWKAPTLMLEQSVIQTLRT